MCDGEGFGQSAAGKDPSFPHQHHHSPNTHFQGSSVAAVVVVVVVVVAGWGLGKEPETKGCQQSFIFKVSLAVSVHIGQSMPLYRFFNI